MHQPVSYTPLSLSFLSLSHTHRRTHTCINPLFSLSRIPLVSEAERAGQNRNVRERESESKPQRRTPTEGCSAGGRPIACDADGKNAAVNKMVLTRPRCTPLYTSLSLFLSHYILLLVLAFSLVRSLPQLA